MGRKLATYFLLEKRRFRRFPNQKWKVAKSQWGNGVQTDARTHGRTKTIFLVNGFKTPARCAGQNIWKIKATYVSRCIHWCPSLPPFPLSPYSAFIPSRLFLFVIELKFTNRQISSSCELFNMHNGIDVYYSDMFRIQPWTDPSTSFCSLSTACFLASANSSPSLA